VLALVREKYSGPVDGRFGPTLAAEHLASEDGVTVHHDTLRRWMLAAGLWSRARKRSPHRTRRERKAHFGELVQLDGSFHLWYETRGPRGCLMNLVDDATGRTLARLGDAETIWAAADVLRRWIEAYGVPLALYTDWKNVYVRESNAEEQVTGAVPRTQFGRMCASLGIQIIAASSPQAKGRVERNHGTHQDRLVKKLRRLGIATAAAANAFLQRHHAPAQSTVLVREAASGAIEIRYRGRLMRWSEISAPTPKPRVAPTEAGTGSRPRSRPSSDHPWRRGYLERQQRAAELARA